MTGDEARDLFSDAYEGALNAEKRAAFEALLDGDGELQAEYDEFSEFLDETHDLAGALRMPVTLQEFEAGVSDIPVPNLLPGVQRKIRERSHGRFYRDRFAEQAKARWTALIIAVIMALILGVAWFGVTYVQLQVDEPAEGSEQVEAP